MPQVIDVDGGVNFRDFGGYRTVSGGRIRTGRLFRCGQMANLTEAGREQLLDLGVATICDLRFPDERDGEPTPFPSHHPRRVEVPMDPGSAVQLRMALDNRALSAFERREFMREINRELAVEHVTDYRLVIDALLETPNDGFLVHCTAGKDRTGLACAYIKRVLGVSREEAVSDYLMTNDVIDFEGFILPRVQQTYPDATLDDVKSLSGVRASYLEAAFSAIDAEFGSFDQFVTDGLRVTTRERRVLIERYVE